MLDDIFLHFFLDDVGGVLVTDQNGEVLYEDEKAALIRQEKTNWKNACPQPQPGQSGESWDLLTEKGNTYMVLTSTYTDNDGIIQIHYLVDTSVYTEMFRDVTDYSKELKIAKEHDGLTGLFNKRKFLELKQSLFRGQKTIAVFNFDVNNLKQMNDTYGHEMGDRLIKKAADSLKAIEARNVLAFRVGGDEFVVVALHVDNEGAERIRKKWEDALEDLNSRSDDIICVIACGMAFGEEGFDLEQILAVADQRMYEDKKRKKESGSRAEIPVS